MLFFEKNAWFVQRFIEKKESAGFSLLELLMSAAIIMIISGLVLVNFRVGFGEQALNRATQKLVLDLRKTQNMALAGTEISGTTPCGFGLAIPVSASFPISDYQLFAYWPAVCPGNSQKSAGDSTIENLKISESAIEISSADFSNVIFFPPEPRTAIRNLSDTATLSSATITLRIKNNPSKTKIIFINEAGQISIQ
ncbi:MAG: prepilin-type N-terminal cleavage/methylation domain-containing protein [Parcubacteria group bacterium]|nr:prepilin-type N-terminal cleavage/methylation domain-containing protein [Parcubacteria group bacterium]